MFSIDDISEKLGTKRKQNTKGQLNNNIHFLSTNL